MPIVTIIPTGRELHVSSSETLLDALRSSGLSVDSPCGGEGICGKCRVQVEEAHGVAAFPHHSLSPEALQEGWRLACLLVPERDLVIHLPTPAPDACILEGKQLSSDRLDPAAQVVWREGAAWLEYQGEASQKLQDWRRENTPKGLAIDIGTTTLVVTLLDLVTGRELATASSLNPQASFGHDVLSRIQHGSTDKGLSELSGSIHEALNGLIETVCSEAKAQTTEVLDVVVGANTTMLQLAARMDPSPLGQLPFGVDIEGGRSYSCEDSGLSLHPLARVYVPPVAHAYVGSDISSGLLACRFFEREGPVLFVDIGTNGELALGFDGRWSVTSAAAGPAFEGVGISQGMRAAPEVIESVGLEGGRLKVGVIGGGEARGICGSGLIDAVACMRQAGVLDKSGRMLKPGKSSGVAPSIAACLEERDGTVAFALTDSVSLTQVDIRQFQLAKSALRTAIDLLLVEAGLSQEAVHDVVMAGAFGYHLSPENLEIIGLLPAGLAQRASFAGNTSRLGAGMLLLDRNARTSLNGWCKAIQHLSLPDTKRFQDFFVENLCLPGKTPL